MDQILDRAAPGYPSAFEDLDAPPPRLWVRGSLDFSGPRVSIVGARRCCAKARQLARQLGEGLAHAGVTVVSGGALGIDGAAHQGALDAGGTTWVVLPSPLARPAPPSHRPLFNKVLEGGGAWLTEVESETGKHTFFLRNRLVAALGHVVVAVEAKAKSGTRHTIQFARDLGRPVAAYPWGVGDEFGAGCLQWLKEGAHLVTGPQDVMALLEATDAPSPTREAPLRTADPVLEALEPNGAYPDELCAHLDWPIGQVLAHLTSLEMQGRVRVGPGGRFLPSQKVLPV